MAAGLIELRPNMTATAINNNYSKSATILPGVLPAQYEEW
jgi:hypothetical protein